MNQIIPVVLVVDRLPDQILLVESILDGLEIPVFGATNAEEALRIFRKHEHICVFMPGRLIEGGDVKDCVALVAAMLKHNPAAHIIAHTCNDEAIKALCAAGCYDEVRKVPGLHYYNNVTQAVMYFRDSVFSVIPV